MMAIVLYSSMFLQPLFLFQLLLLLFIFLFCRPMLSFASSIYSRLLLVSLFFFSLPPRPYLSLFSFLSFLFLSLACLLLLPLPILYCQFYLFFLFSFLFLHFYNSDLVWIPCLYPLFLLLFLLYFLFSVFFLFFHSGSFTILSCIIYPFFSFSYFLSLLHTRLFPYPCIFSIFHFRSCLPRSLILIFIHFFFAFSSSVFSSSTLTCNNYNSSLSRSFPSLVNSWNSLSTTLPSSHALCILYFCDYFSSSALLLSSHADFAFLVSVYNSFSRQLYHLSTVFSD